MKLATTLSTAIAFGYALELTASVRLAIQTETPLIRPVPTRISQAHVRREQLGKILGE
jgi:hypothetical protein